MAEAVRCQRWVHTASLMCMIANCHRDPKKTRQFHPIDFMPRQKSRKEDRPKVGIGVLKQVFVNCPQGE